MEPQTLTESKKENIKKNPFNNSQIHKRKLNEQIKLQKNKTLNINKIKTDIKRNKNLNLKKNKLKNYISNIMLNNKLEEKNIKDIMISFTKEHENKIFKKNDKNNEKNKELNINKLISKNLRYYNKNIYIFQKQKNDLFNDNDSLKENNIISRRNLRTNLSINIEDLNQRQFKKYMTNPKNTVNASINNHNKKSKNIKNLPNNEEKINSGNINIKKINIIDSDNELYFSESNRINNIKTKQFPTLLANLFSIKLIKNRLTLNKNSKNYIDSENKFTKKVNDNIIHNYSSLNTNIYDIK